MQEMIGLFLLLIGLLIYSRLLHSSNKKIANRTFNSSMVLIFIWFVVSGYWYGLVYTFIIVAILLGCNLLIDYFIGHIEQKVDDVSSNGA